jgi:OmcA/MtrC family decaheme c-type cytochrome
MNRHRTSSCWIDLPLKGDYFRGLAVSLLTLVLTACGGGGGGGSTSAPPPPVNPPVAASALNITVTGISVNSPPVVNFKVTDQSGAGVPGLVAADLRFNIAKLVPGSNGGPSVWQDYINRVNGGAVQGSQERTATGYSFGTLANHGDGSYTYSFATDITKATCPAPCTDAGGKALDLSYQPGLTHRVGIQQANSAYPKASGILDFVPSGSGGTRRDIVATATCNACHVQLTVHGTRVDTRLCVSCHNPGSWVAGTPNTTVDFKVMIHKIHYNNNGAALPSVIAGTPYKIGNADFSSVVFPQDVRNCTRCHDGTPGAANFTPQGDNWKTAPNMDACGACHDDVYFGAQPDPAKPYQTKPHSGGIMTDSSACALCHAAGKFPDNKDIVLAHDFPARFKAASAKFRYNILSVAPSTAGAAPVVTFSVTDPTNADAPYDIKADQAFTQTANGTSRLAVSIGWNTADIANSGSGANYGQPVSIDALASSVAGTTAGTYTVLSPVAIPAGQTGTLRVTIDGHPAGDVTTPGSFTDRLQVTSVFKDAAISGSVSARRVVVDIAKCDVCHDVLSLHGNNRTDEPQVCVVCHNPNATDAGRRPATGGTLTGGVDGKLEESIDFKTMIHAIHAGQADQGGFRTKGITIYGFGGSVNDFSKVVFPGKLNDCAACHAGTSYQLRGTWDAPTANGILSNTISTAADPADPTDNLRISPIAAVCSSCHDTALARLHMEDSFNGGVFSATQAAISAGAPEACSFCHGAGKVLDVKTVHGVN